MKKKIPPESEHTNFVPIFFCIRFRWEINIFIEKKKIPRKEIFDSKYFFFASRGFRPPHPTPGLRHRPPHPLGLNPQTNWLPGIAGYHFWIRFTKTSKSQKLKIKILYYEKKFKNGYFLHTFRTLRIFQDNNKNWPLLEDGSLHVAL